MVVRIITGLTAATALLTSCLQAESGKPALVDGQKIKIVLVGDSTVTDTAGWGRGFKQYVNDHVVCVNTAVGGRSSMTFIKEDRWEKALALKGDYYLIQFGHNNEPGKPGRSTDMPTLNSNMVQYVDDTRAIGAKPVLVTPLTRRQWDKEHPGKIKSSLAPYAAEVRKIAAEKHVPLVDLHARSIELCESFGPEKCLEFSPFAVSNGRTNYDGTHLNAKGGVLFARLVVDDLRKAAPGLTSYLRAEPGPVKPPKVYNVDNFGAKGDGKTLDTVAIQKTLDICGQDGGGIVRLTAGTYLCKPIFLRGNTNLRLDAGATIQATDRPEDFLNPMQPDAPLALVNAEALNSVAITGNGAIDGAGRRWWDEARSVRAGKGGPIKRPRLVVFSNCVDVKYEDVTLQNSPGSHLVLVDCENVSISGTVFESPQDAPDTDAIVLNASRYVTIHDCLMIVGGADIAIKSDHQDITHPDAASEHITIKDCGFLKGTGLCIGNEIQGGVHDLVVSNCSFNGTAAAISIKSAFGVGGKVANLVYQNLKINNVESPINFTCLEPDVSETGLKKMAAPSLPVYRDFLLENVTATGAQAAGWIVGVPESAISNVLFKSVSIAALKGMTVRNARGIEFRNSLITVQHGSPLNLETNASVIGLPFE